jgi:chorismate mutase/prephenate dehydrogenase
MDLIKLKILRDELDVVDRALIDCMAKRQAIVADIGKLKEAGGGQLRDFKREAEVLAKVRERAEQSGLDPQIAGEVMKHLIAASLVSQEQRRLRVVSEGHDKRVLLFGGNGKMGRWFAAFFEAQGYVVEVSDPSGAPPGTVAVLDWQARAPMVDVIVIAATLQQSERLLKELNAIATKALIFDIGSVKSPLMAALEALAVTGHRVCSIHPMFGPSTNLLSGRHVLFMPVGTDEAMRAAQALFAATPVEQLVLPLREHDELIAFVLGLSHAVNIAFVHALEKSHASMPHLLRASSTTFDRQLKVAQAVVGENPHLYFEIQHLNRARELSLCALEEAVGTLLQAVRSGNEAAFVRIMEAGREFLEARAEGRVDEITG